MKSYDINKCELDVSKSFFSVLDCPVCEKGSLVKVNDIVSDLEKDLNLKGSEEVLISKIGKNKLLIEISI